MNITAFPTLNFSDAFLRKPEEIPCEFIQTNFSAKKVSFHFRGANAIYHGLKRLSLPKGSTVLMPAYHCGVEVDAVLRNKLEVKFYHLDDKLNVDLTRLNGFLDETVKVLFVIHYFGMPQPMGEISRFCQKHQILLFEDCAHALYSRGDGRVLGTAGDLSIFSLQKSLPVVDGGVLIENQNNNPLRFNDEINPISLRRTKMVYWMNHLKLNTPGVFFLLNGIFFTPAKYLFRVFKKSRSSKGLAVATASTHDLNEEYLELGISQYSKQIFALQQENVIVQKRRKNYQTLLDGLNEENSRYIVYKYLA
ncbi:MAG: DegT/DnrJ/EryC1/StrS aminotransferase family protein, partial [Candidatus Omnitrophica bacterium]|nr:DegT/DnrJ/EryC1/StrS aminotransferase family protein [Candidatus Omnitrophota bacterium]